MVHNRVYALGLTGHGTSRASGLTPKAFMSPRGVLRVQGLRLRALASSGLGLRVGHNDL